jgi:hypothetical protein
LPDGVKSDNKALKYLDGNLVWGKFSTSLDVYSTKDRMLASLYTSFHEV